MEETSQKKASWSLGSVIGWIVLPLVAGLLLSLLIPQPKIGVIRFSEEIYADTANDLIAQIDYAREHSEISAVVIVMNSPGGTVVDTEAIYMELARLREVKPVVTVIEGMAASGGYYLSVGTDYIFAKPTSQVGNIGILGYLPESPAVYEELYSTGPYKLWLEPRDAFIRSLEPLKQAFLQAVKLGRGSALKADDATILRGQIWSGADALRLGLVDELGTQSQALDKAAEMARVNHYQVIEIREKVTAPQLYTQYGGAAGSADAAAQERERQAGVYYLYIPPTQIEAEVKP